MSFEIDDNLLIKKPGELLQGGLVYCGISPSTGKPFASRKLPEKGLSLNYRHAFNYAVTFEGNEQPMGSFRLPTSQEMKLLSNTAEFNGHDHFRGMREKTFWTSDKKSLFFAWYFRPSSGFNDYLLTLGNDLAIKLVCDLE